MKSELCRAVYEMEKGGTVDFSVVLPRSCTLVRKFWDVMMDSVLRI
jgi:hypothetical protein